MREPVRKLEIGPGRKRIPGFETVNVIKTPVTDHVADARALPFEAGVFDLVYASHVIEHLPWYETDDVLKDWFRVLKSGGALEVWTVDAYKVAKALVEYEEDPTRWVPRDSWGRFGVDSDPFLWCAGRIFAYGRDDGEDSVNWHRALFTTRHLGACFRRAGFKDMRPMDRSEVRGADHGWVNLGVSGVKP